MIANTSSSTDPTRTHKEAAKPCARVKPFSCTRGFVRSERFPIAALVVALMLASPIAAAGQDAAPTAKPSKPAPTAKPVKPDAPAYNVFEEYKQDYVAGREPVLINIRKAKYLTIVGKGTPGGQDFGAKTAAIYSTAFGLKIRSKTAGRDFTLTPLEALWWGEEDRHNFLDESGETWNWKIMIRVPDFVAQADLIKVLWDSAKKSPDAAPPEVKLETITEGPCVQVLHIGPYSTESETIDRMRAFAKKRKLSFNGDHHEIYLGDPTKTAPEELQTILRQPVKLPYP